MLHSHCGVIRVAIVCNNEFRQGYASCAKTFAAWLESLTASFSLTTVFSCFDNAFTALECSTTTFFDIILVQKDLRQFNAYHLLGILKEANCPTPVVLLENDELGIVHEHAINTGFSGVLYRSQLSTHICSVLSYAIEHPVSLFNRTHHYSEGSIAKDVSGRRKTANVTRTNPKNKAKSSAMLEVVMNGELSSGTRKKSAGSYGTPTALKIPRSEVVQTPLTAFLNNQDNFVFETCAASFYETDCLNKEYLTNLSPALVPTSIESAPLELYADFHCLDECGAMRRSESLLDVYCSPGHLINQ